MHLIQKKPWTSGKRNCCEDLCLAWCSFLAEVDAFVGNGTNGCHFPCKNCLEAGYSLKLFFSVAQL